MPNDTSHSLRPAVRAALAALVIGTPVALLLAPQPRPAWLPDPKLTPGAVVDLPVDAICQRGYAHVARDVSEADKKAVFVRYGLRWEDRSKYEVDHLIPLACGGSNSILNLWCQPWEGPLGARHKDSLEVRLRSLVCSGRMPLATAQAAFRGDWTIEYRRQGLDKPRLGAGPEGDDDVDPEGFEPEGGDNHAPS